MGYNGTRDHLNRIYRYDFYPPCSLTPNSVYSRGAIDKSIFRADQFPSSPKLDMYPMPMPSIFNFHLKVEDNQHQFSIPQGPSNGMFLKKELPVNSQGQLIMPPVAHSSQAISIVTPSQNQGPSVSSPAVLATDEFVLEHHAKIDKSNTKPYTCNYCSKVYKQLMGIKNHVKTHLQSNNEAIVNCSICGKSMACRNSPGVKPFVCPTCRDVKSQIASQQQHHANQNQQLTHQQLLHQPHSSYNQSSTSSPSKSSSTAQIHSNDEEEDCPESEKHYQCQYCHKRFQHPSTLKMHLKKHTDDKPFVCEYCNKNFKRNSSLKIHARTHTGEKTHECSYCGKLFAYEVFLKVHLRKHTGEKPYACSACDKTFTQAGNLKSHMKRKHLIGI